MDGDVPGLSLHAQQIGEERSGQIEHGTHKQSHDRREGQRAVGRAIGLGDVARPPMAGHQRRRPDSHQPKDHPSQPADIRRQPDRIGGRRADLAGKVRVVETDEKRQELFEQGRQRQDK